MEEAATTVRPPETASDVLTQQEAEARASRVGNVRYDLDIDLARGSETYRGAVAVSFELAGDGQPGDDSELFLDFRGRRIERLEVNGRTVEPQWNGYRLALPGAALASRNEVRVAYENEYDHTGEGLHQFLDPEDGEEYVYTHFEPYGAHRLFPGFDQPDIKAVYRLTVTAPTDWAVIANSAEIGAGPAADGRTTHSFEPTVPFSTYLVALVAGPYQLVSDRHGDIPLGLHCRKSMLPYLDADELFEITRQGLGFFTALFDYPYPFGKYDQIFVPEFNPGAMENIAAVTHQEDFIFRDPPTENQRLTRAEVLLHEMAHMWFGNLVTLRWWNDLWLNESFATYLAFRAMAEVTRFTKAWQSFTAMKRWAYRQDQLVTTHPIAGPCPDTDATFLNFDGITYGKGAAVIKQLVAAIGFDGFREGMRLYFRRHARGNATLSDFLRALEEGSGHQLQEWSRLWLETPSLNTLAATWRSDDGRLTDLRLSQTAPAAYPTLRPHTVEIALGHERHGAVAVDAVQAEIAGESAGVPAAAGLPAPTFVFPNHNDHAFAKVALDPTSLVYVRDRLERVEDPLLRQLLWMSLWDMVRDRQLASTAYLALVRAKIALEPDLELVESTLRSAVGVLNDYVPAPRLDEEAHAFFGAAWEALRAAPRGDAQIIWARTLIGAGQVRGDVAFLTRLADGEESVPGFTVDQEMRWSIAVKTVAYGLDGAEERVAAEHGRDPSDRGQRAVIRAGASRPTAEAKAEAWRRIHEEGYGSLHLTAAAMSGFNWRGQRAILEPYVERFFESVSEIVEKRDHPFAADYFQELFPAYRVEPAILQRSERLLAQDGDRLPILARMLREASDDLARAIGCRAYAESHAR